jgi:hypothetical protein
MADELITITGIPETLRFLEEAPKVIVVNTFVKAFAAASEPITEALTANTPVQFIGPREKGERRLIDSIVVDLNIDPSLKGAQMDIGFEGRPQGSKANWLEYGHRIVGHKPNLKDTGKRTTPTFFMRKSVDASYGPAIEKWSDEYMDGVNQEYGS